MATSPVADDPAPPKRRDMARVVAWLLVAVLVTAGGAFAVGQSNVKFRLPLALISDPGQRAVRQIEDLGGKVTVSRDQEQKVMGVTVFLGVGYAGGEEGLAYLEQIPDLNEVMIESFTIRDSAMPALGRLTGLNRLWITAPAITDQGVRELAALKKLTYLNLTGVQLTDQGLAALAELSDLEQLDLTGTRISDAVIEPLKRYPKLVRLWIYETKLTPNGIAELQREFPSLDIMQPEQLQRSPPPR